MTRRLLSSIGALTTLAAVLALGAIPLAGQAPTGAKPASAPAKVFTPAKTADGQPDLSGYWTNATYTRLERPKGVTKEYYTLEEVVAAEKAAAAVELALSEPGTPRDVHYDEGQFALTRTQSTFHRNLRTSLILDPPDGRLPPMTAEAQKRLADLAEARKLRGPRNDMVQNHMVDTRCIIMGGTAPPMLPPGYLSNLQISQSPGYVSVIVERLHDARLIPLDGRPFPSDHLRSWVGVSRGRWQGNTLVVESRNFNNRRPGVGDGTTAGLVFRGATQDMRVTERFTPVDANTIRYNFTVEDPKTWTKPWTAELDMVRLSPHGPMFEFACHEGNYSMLNMLGIARLEEKRAAEAAKKKGSN